MDDQYLFLLYLAAFLLFSALVFFLFAGWKKRKKKTNLVLLACFSLVTVGLLIYALTPAPLLDPDVEVKHLTVYEMNGSAQRDITKEIDKEAPTELLSKATRSRLPKWFDYYPKEDVDYVIMGCEDVHFFNIYLGNITMLSNPDELGGYAIHDGAALLAEFEALLP